MSKKSWPTETTKCSTLVKLTFAYVDTSSDVWVWAIVTDYKNPQDYGEILVAFNEDMVPNRLMVVTMLNAIVKKLETGITIQHLID
jgi:hypothetical protein